MSFNQLNYDYAYLTVTGTGIANSWLSPATCAQLEQAIAEHPILQQHEGFQYLFETRTAGAAVHGDSGPHASQDYLMFNFGRHIHSEDDALHIWLQLLQQHLQAKLRAPEFKIILHIVIHGCNFQDADFYLAEPCLQALRGLGASVQVSGHCFDDGHDFPYSDDRLLEVAFASQLSQTHSHVCALRIEVDGVEAVNHADERVAKLPLPVHDVSLFQNTLSVEIGRHETNTDVTAVWRLLWQDLYRHREALQTWQQATQASYQVWLTGFVPRHCRLDFSAAELDLLASLQCELDGDVYFDTEY